MKRPDTPPPVSQPALHPLAPAVPPPAPPLKPERVPIVARAASPVLPPTPQPTIKPVKAPLPDSTPIVTSPSVHAPGRLTAQWQPHGMIHLSWEPGSSDGQYRLYSASSQDFDGARILQEDMIPMTWWDWMPPEGPSTVWLAVSQILPSGGETPVSQPVEIKIP